jgi:hypothetical protein
MDRRHGARAQVDLPVSALVDGTRHRCRAIDISPTGMVVERAPGLSGRALAIVTPFELQLGTGRPIRLRGRPVWDRDNHVAVRFVVMNDADRLTIAEHLDRRVRERAPLH